MLSSSSGTQLSYSQEEEATNHLKVDKLLEYNQIILTLSTMKLNIDLNLAIFHQPFQCAL